MRTIESVKASVGIGLALTLPAMALVGCNQAPDFLFGRSEQRVVLANKPTLLDTKPVHLSANVPLEVRGVMTNLCLRLSNDVKEANEASDISAEYERLKGGAHLLAVLHASDGKDYEWKCGNWSFSPIGAGAGSMDACMRWECNQTPPKGTKIASIDLSSDRPLQILGVNWSSTGAFDFMSQPPPDRVAFSSAEYRDLEHAFGGQTAWPSTAKSALQVTLTSNLRQASSSHFNSTLSIRMTDAGVQLEPGPSAVGIGVVTIPVAAIESCSMTCSGNLVRETDLLLPGQGIKFGLLNTPELIDWCWDHHVPMATSASMRAWLYNKTPLPAKDSYTDQFQSRAAYDAQAHRSCMGY